MKTLPTYEEINKDFESGKLNEQKEIYTMLGRAGHHNHLADEWKNLLCCLEDAELREKYNLNSIESVIEFMTYRENDVCFNYCGMVPGFTKAQDGEFKKNPETE